MAECFLLDALPAAIQHVASELDDVERVHHLDRVRERFGGGLEPGEPVHRHDLDPGAERLGLLIQPGPDHGLRAAFDHVQQACRAGPIAHRRQVDDHRHVAIPEPRVAPGVLADTEHGDAVEAVRVLDQASPALGTAVFAVCQDTRAGPRPG
jgi:hypothetical protein